MDFGAVICKPYPLCHDCVFKYNCFAYNNGLVSELPVKGNKLKIRTRWFNYLLIDHNKKTYIHKRTSDDIWNNLYEFVLIESTREVSVKKILSKAENEKILKKDAYHVVSISPLYTQQLSHQKILGRFIRLAVKKELVLPGFKAVSLKQLSRFAFPRIINAYFERTNS